MKDSREKNMFYRSDGRGWQMHCVLSGCIESNAKRFIWSRSRRRVSRLSENCVSMGAYQPFRHCQAKPCSTIRACCRCAALFKLLEQQSQLRRLDSVTPINVIFQNVDTYAFRKNMRFRRNSSRQLTSSNFGIRPSKL